MILICYDRSSGSRAAVARAAELFPDKTATVLTVWERFEEIVRHTFVGFAPVLGPPDVNAIDEASRDDADEAAAEGAQLAGRLGMTALPRSAARETTPARAILAEADTLGVTAIVVGSRGRTGVRSLLLGSVAHELVQHANRAVVVVPSEEVAASRSRTMRNKAAI